MKGELDELFDENRFVIGEMTQSIEFVLANGLKMDRNLMIQILRDSNEITPEFRYIVKVESSTEWTDDGDRREMWNFTFTDR